MNSGTSAQAPLAPAQAFGGEVSRLASSSRVAPSRVPHDGPVTERKAALTTGRIPDRGGQRVTLEPKRLFFLSFWSRDSPPPQGYRECGLGLPSTPADLRASSHIISACTQLPPRTPFFFVSFHGWRRGLLLGRTWERCGGQLRHPITRAQRNTVCERSLHT